MSDNERDDNEPAKETVKAGTEHPAPAAMPAGRVVDVRDGGVATLRLSHHPTGEVRVTDLTTGTVADPDAFETGKQSVKRAAGMWARGRGRWRVEYDTAD